MNWFKSFTKKRETITNESEFSQVLKLMDNERTILKESLVVNTKHQKITLGKNHMIVYSKYRKEEYWIFYSDMYNIDEIIRYSVYKHKRPIIRISAKNIKKHFILGLEFEIINKKERQLFLKEYLIRKNDFTERLIEMTREREKEQKNER